MGSDPRRFLRGLALLLLPPALYLGTLGAINSPLAARGLSQAVNMILARRGLPYRLRLARLHVDPILRVRLDGVTIEVRAPDEPVILAWRRVILPEPLLRVWRDRTLTVVLHDGQVRSPGVNLDGFSAVLHDIPWGRLPQASAPRPLGMLRIHHLRSGAINIRGLLGEIWQEGSHVRVRPMLAQVYSGFLTGSVEVDWSKHPPMVALDAQITNLPLADLAPLSPDLFRHAEGRTIIAVSASGRPGHPLHFTCAAQVDQPGGAMEAPFLKAILPYLPPASLQGTRLPEILERGDPVRFRSVLFRVESVSPTEIKALLLMALPEYNRHFDIDFTIRLDDATALSQLMALWQDLFG